MPSHSDLVCWKGLPGNCTLLIPFPCVGWGSLIPLRHIRVGRDYTPLHGKTMTTTHFFSGPMVKDPTRDSALNLATSGTGLQRSDFPEAAAHALCCGEQPGHSLTRRGEVPGATRARSGPLVGPPVPALLRLGQPGHESLDPGVLRGPEAGNMHTSTSPLLPGIKPEYYGQAAGQFGIRSEAVARRAFSGAKQQLLFFAFCSLGGWHLLSSCNHAAALAL